MANGESSGDALGKLWRSSKTFWERLWWANCELAASGGGEGNHDSF